MRQEYLIALGANLPSPVGLPIQTLGSALTKMSGAGFQLRRVGRFFSTPAFPCGNGPDYVNSCVVVASDLRPKDALRALHAIEMAYDRERTNRWGARTLDLDLIACGDCTLPDVPTFEHWAALPPDAQARSTPDQIILPHPRLQDRAFVLVPLCDVAPQWRHPVLGQTARALCDALPDADRVAVTPL